MSTEVNEKRFVQRMRELLISLPYDMKVLFEALSDENLPNEARQLAAVSAIYCLSPFELQADGTPLIGYADDAVVLRLTLKRLTEIGGEDAANYPTRFIDQFAILEEDLALLNEYLGSELLDWIQLRLEKNMRKVKYKGKSASEYIEDDEACEFLYEEGQTFTTQYEIDDKAASKFQSGKPLLDALNRRMTEESRRIA